MNLKPISATTGGLTDEEILKFERTISRILPEDYIEFLRQFNGAEPARTVVITLAGGSNHTDVRLLFGIGPEVELEVLRVEYHLYNRPLEHSDSIAVAHDSGGNMFWLSLNPHDYGSVYFVHDDWPPSSGKVASSWSEFLDLIATNIDDD